MKPDNVLSMLGIAAKAGKVSSGSFLTEHAVKSGGAHLVIVAMLRKIPKRNFAICANFTKLSLPFMAAWNSLGAVLAEKTGLCSH